MQLRADIQLRAAIKALGETIAPAIDPDNKLAAEQMQMVIGTLKLVTEHLPLQFQFDRDELGRLLALAQAMQDTLAGAGAGDLDGVRRAAADGTHVLDRARADPAEVLDAVRDLRAECCAATTLAYRHGTPAVRKTLTECVLGYSKEQTLRDRSWLLHLGFESPDAGIPPIADLLASGGDAR